MLFENKKTRVLAFVGPSGTGKSYRAQMVASENNINYIIDDGLLIRGNEVIAGVSAKKAPTKIETVKQALFLQQEKRDAVKKAIKKYRPEGILILGTSDKMVKEIASNLGLPEIEKIIYITEVATEAEMKTARRIRVTQGKHVIPVPTFEIKKDFSGYILDPLQIFRFRIGSKPYISEKSIIRPTFSYLGNLTISDTVFRQIIEYLAKKTPAIYRILKVRIENYGEGPYIYMEVSIVFGNNVITTLSEFRNRCVKEIENATTMNVQKIEVIAKEIYVPKKEENK